MNKISVFCATGFIGSHFCEMYPDEVIKIPREQRVPESNKILYLISTTDNYNVFNDITLDVKTNLLVLMEVLRELRDNIFLHNPEVCFNFVSSWFVYGTEIVDEKDLCNPKGFYSITKYCAEKLLISFCETFNIKYRIFRLANTYGVGDKDVSDKKNVFLHFIKKIKNNEDIESYWGGISFRDYIHVKDVCRAIHLCMEKAPYNEIINIGTGRSVLFKYLMEYAINKLNSKSKIIEISPTKFHQIVQVSDFFMLSNKLKSYGFMPEITIEQGIDEYIESLK